MMIKSLAPLILLSSIAAGGCSMAPTASAADVEAALQENRYLDAKSALLAIREDEGASISNSKLLAQVMIELGDGYTAERYLTATEDASDPEWVALRAHAAILQGRARQAGQLLDGFTGQPLADGTFDWLRVWATMEEGEIEEAEALVDAALRRYPRSAPLHAKAARLSVWRDNWDAAQRHYDEALDYDPTNYEALLVRGEGQIHAGDLEEALTSYETAAQLYPDFAVPKANAAGLLLDLRRLDEAERVLDSAFQSHPQFALLRFQAARLSALKGEWANARQTVQALPSEWKREFPAATLLEGEIESALGNHAMARTLYARLSGDPQFAQQVAGLLGQLPPE